LESLASALSELVRKLTNKAYVDEKDIEELVRDLQRALLRADVPVELVYNFSETIRSRVKERPTGVTAKEYAIKVLYEELTKLLGSSPVEIAIKSKPTRWLFVGIQGYGKTTTVAKVAYYYKKLGYSVCAVSIDTFRPAALEQLKQLLEPYEIPVIGNPQEKDPVKAFFYALEEMKKENITPDIILIDTAGRHKEEKPLLEELKTIVEKIKPDATFLVLDASIGQRAKAQAEAFSEIVKIGYIILTKMDFSAKGGGALAAVAATNAKVVFIGTGEKISDLKKFVPIEYASNLLGIPNLKDILKKVSETIDVEKARKFSTGKFTLEEFVYQVLELSKSDMYSTIIKMLPNVKKIPQNYRELTEEKAKVWLSILNSMNKEERENPSILNSSRIRRIARGSGRSEREVKELIEQFEKSKKIMKKAKSLRGIIPF